MSHKEIDPFSKELVHRALKSWHNSEKLGEHPLARIRIVEEAHRKEHRSDSPSDRGRRLRGVLEEAIKELGRDAAGPNDTGTSLRPDIILTQRFIKERDPGYLMIALAVEKSTYYKMQRDAIMRLADILRQWEDKARGIPTTQYPLTNERDSLLTNETYSFTTLIESKTRDFVGREFVFKALETFLAENDQGYFIVQGEPGIGKTTLAAQLVKTRGYVHHFNDATLGIVQSNQFLQNVSLQLTARYQLDRYYGRPEAHHSGAFLVGLLAATSSRLEGKQAIIIVDALDEAERSSDPRASVLHLPPHLPRGVFFVVTFRPIADFPLLVEAPNQTFYLEAHSEGNLEDVQEYLTQAAWREGIQAQLKAEGMSLEDFVEVLLKKSEGNFMYLRYVVPEIESGKHPGLKVQDLPQGLRGYYERHWRQMRAEDEDMWVEYRQPVICVLAAVREPISVEQLASFSKLSVVRVRAALRVWREFLIPESIEGQKRYRIYHTSFRDFLREKDEVGELDLTQFRNQITDVLLEDLNGEDDE